MYTGLYVFGKIQDLPKEAGHKALQKTCSQHNVGALIRVWGIQ